MDSGDTGTEEVAKKRFDPLLPCSSSRSRSLRGSRAAEEAALSVSSPLTFFWYPARVRKLVSWLQRKHGWELGGSTLSQERSLARGRASASESFSKEEQLRQPRLEVDCGPLTSLLYPVKTDGGLTGCARPRGSARTSRYVCRSSWALSAPNKFSERAAKTAVRRE